MSGAAARKPTGERAPGPKGFELLRLIRALKRDAATALLELHDAYGDVVQLDWFGRPSTLIAHPEEIRQVLAERWTNYAKGPFFEVFKPLLGEGLVTNDGEVWRRHRKLLHPLFARDRLDGLVPIAAGEADALIGRWRGSAEVELTSELERLTLAFIVRALFRPELLERVDAMCEHFAVASREGVRRARSPLRLPLWLPTPHHRAWNRARRALDALVLEQIAAARRAATPDHGALLDRMVAARGEDGRALDDGEIRDELLTFLFAGYETTATALAWTFDFLSRRPDLQESVRRETAGLFDGGEAPSARSVLDLPRTGAVLQESLRLRPPVYAIQRRALGDDELGGYPVPAGSGVVLSAYVTHRRHSPWPDPELFRPERWLGSPPPDRFAHFPFGAGPRACVGAHWTFLEATVVVAKVVGAFELRAAAPNPPGQRTLTTLQPSSKIVLHLQSIDH